MSQSPSQYEGQGDRSLYPYQLPITASPDTLLDKTQTPVNENGKPQPCWKSPTFAGICLALGKWWNWNTVLISSCVIAVCFDPLFFYIPYTIDARKCIGRDRHVQTVALIFRSLTDIGYLVHIVYQLQAAIKFGLSVVTKDESLVMKYESVTSKQMGQFITGFSHKLSWRSFLADVLSILPLPQVLIVGSFFKIGGTDYRMKRKILSGFVLAQFVPRTYRIYLSYSSITESALWLRGLFNLFLYILASHVLGAFWYFFSIQRETSCWYQNCVDAKNPESKCIFYCHGNDVAPLLTSQYNTTLNEQCLLKVPNNMTDPPFDFGIFFDLLKNDMQGKNNFPEKIGYCFWWGLRNLSNFGTSLVTSTYLWENIFAVVISVVGLLLFLYLIGNVQIYMERSTTRTEEVREKLLNKKNDIDEWLENLGVKDDMKEEIKKSIKKKLEENINADLENLYSLLPGYTRKTVTRIVGMKKLREVPILKNVDASVLKLICDNLKSVIYKENTMIFHSGEALDRMLFITNGTAIRYSHHDHSRSHSSDVGEAITTQQLLTSRLSIDTHLLKRGDFYGDQLLHYATSNAKPILVESIKCDTKVEALVLKATDLATIASLCIAHDCWPYFPNLLEDQVPALPGRFPQRREQQPAGPKKRAQTHAPV